MTELRKGPQGQRRGRGARERILEAAERLFREQGINNTGMDQLCAAAQVSKRTAYQHFGTKDGLIAEYLRRIDADTMSTVFDHPELAPRERLLAVFERPSTTPAPTPPASGPAGSVAQDGCPFIGAAVEIADPEHPARVLAREHKESVAARLAAIAREAGAADPDLLGEQLALLVDGGSSRTHTLGTDAMPTAVGIATALIDHALPADGGDVARARPAAVQPAA
jgi:AcrR family transcriptional regulator